jgi:flagellar basal-body rod protein FlgB
VRIFDATTATLERALDVRLERHTVLASNLANVDTPGFVPQDVDFRAAMSGAQGGSSPDETPEAAPGPGEIPLNLASYSPPSAAGLSGLSSGLAATSATAGSSPGIDGNAVDADRALVAIAENAVQYGAAARAVSKKLAILRYVASDGAA